MNLIQEWSHPAFIYLLIPVMAGMLLYVRRQVWKYLRTYEIESTLSKEALPPLRPFIIHSICAEIAAFVISTVVTILIVKTIPLLTFALMMVFDMILVLGVYFYEEYLIRRYGYVSQQIVNNLTLLRGNSGIRFHSARPLIFVLMLCMLILAMMGPEGPERNTHLRRIPVHSTILFDLSRSMNATDIKPSRLSAAKDEAISLLRKSSGDEIGLIYFTDTTVVQSPQTYDVESLGTFLAQADPAIMPGHGTDLNKALRAALHTFDANDDMFYLESGLDLRRVVLITDGETHTGDLDATLAVYQSRRIHIDVIAFGTQQGSRIKDDQGNDLTYESQPVVSKLQKETLTHIAEQTGGIYTEFTVPEHAADSLIAKWDGARIDVNPGHAMMTSSYRIPLYPYFLHPAYFLLCMFLCHPLMIALIKKRRQRPSSPNTGEPSETPAKPSVTQGETI